MTIEKSDSNQGDTPRAHAVHTLLARARDLLSVGDLRWSQVQDDWRILVVNHAIRRQLECIEATLVLASKNLGHHAVSYIRPALEEMLWIRFLVTLSSEVSQRLILALGSYDALRSLSAQRDYIGDKEMADLWYTKDFLEAREARLSTVKDDLKSLRSELGWQGTLPSTKWVAETVSEVQMFEYLHSATSRAVHFSVGEILRRAWGHPEGRMVTAEPGFREHLSEFALDRLWRLLFETVASSMSLLDESGISISDPLNDDVMMPIIAEVLALGQVPLVHAAEWNLTPDGPMK